MRSIFVLALLAFSLASQAQTSKGNFLLGGSVTFNSAKEKVTFEGSSETSQATTTLGFTPNAGYFIMDNLAVGGSLTLLSVNEKESDSKTSTFLFAPFVRYYFLSLGENVKFMGQGSFGIGSLSFDGESQSINSWAVNAGPAIFLNSNTALEITLGYNSTGYKEEGAKFRTNSIGFNVGFQIHLGK